MKSPRQDTLKMILCNQRRALASTNCLNLRGKNIQDLNAIGVQKHLKQLLISETPLESIDTLPPQPNLTDIKADHSSINSFEGISKQKQLKSISFIGTPLAEKENFRLTCLILIGQRLNYINGKSITAAERSDAATYPQIAKILLEHGWELDYPAPTSDEFKEIAKLYELNIKDYPASYFIPQRTLLPAEKIKDEIDEEEDKEDVTYLDTRDEDLVTGLIRVLKKSRIGVKNDENAKAELLDIISSLAEATTYLDQFSNEIQGIDNHNESSNIEENEQLHEAEESHTTEEPKPNDQVANEAEPTEQTE